MAKNTTKQGKTYPKQTEPEKLDVAALIKSHQGIRLDIACGRNKQGPTWVGIDVLPLPGVDIVHNIELVPWPLPDNCVSVAIASHIMEHLMPIADPARLDALIQLMIEKKLLSDDEVKQHLGEPGAVFLRVMNEIWRVMQVGGQLAMVMPYAGSPGFHRDPTHINNINEETWAYFSPIDPTFGHTLWQFYEAKPWQIEQNMWSANGNLEVVLKKLPDVYSMSGQDLVVADGKK